MDVVNKKSNLQEGWVITNHIPVQILPADVEFFSTREQLSITSLNTALAEAYLAQGSEQEHQEECKVALRRYLETLTFLRRRHRMFEIANHRLFRTAHSLIVPYDAHGRLSIYAVQMDSEKPLKQLRLPHGTLITDDLIAFKQAVNQTICQQMR